jgi:O-antigen/teichoic acid export membrane protein
MARALLTTAGFLALIIAGATLLPFYAVAPAVGVAALLITAYVARDLAPRHPTFNATRWRALARETAIYAAATALGAVYFQVALVSTSLLTGDRETGIFAIAFRIVDLANGVPWLLAGSVFPVLAHAAANDAQRLRFAIGRVTDAGVIAGGWFALTIVLGAKFGIRVVAGDSADDAVGVLRILAIGVMATFLVAAWGFVLLSMRSYRELVIANGGALALAIVLSLILVPLLGASGAAATTATLEVVLAIAYGTLIARKRPELVPSAAIVPRLILALAVAFAVGLPLLLIHPVPATIAGGLAYFGVLRLLGAIPPEILAALPTRRRAGTA